MRKFAIGAAALVIAAALITPTPAVALDEVNSQRLRRAVTVNGVLEHERVFQRIANQNGGTRASGTPGYDASAAYVAGQLRRAGYRVTLQEFTFPFFRVLAPAQLRQVGPTPTDYETGTFTYSGSGDVTGELVPIDLTVPPTPAPSSTSGCEAADFPAPPSATSIALLQRGTCSFQIKTENATAAGYAAAVIFNDGQPGREGLIQNGTLGVPQPIPVVDLGHADGAALYAATQAGEVRMRVFASTEGDLARKTVNVIADSPAAKNGEVVVVGAHLDSVPEGPGINDNGSGSGSVLEIAEQLSALGYTDRLQRRVRFAFWGAEERGLLGSRHYVESLTDAQLKGIYANLNFDMVGSPNYVRFVYDGDGSTVSPAGPAGSGAIEEIFTSYFASQGLASEPTAFDGRSDYGPFIAVGIPAGGLFTGAEGLKTEAQAATYGGTAGAAYDPCYHQACDTMTNVSTKALSEMGDAAAHATLTLARSKTGLFEDTSRIRPTMLETTDLQGHALQR